MAERLLHLERRRSNRLAIHCAEDSTAAERVFSFPFLINFFCRLHLEPGGAPQPGGVAVLRASLPQPGGRQPGVQGQARVLPAGHGHRQRPQEAGQGDRGERVHVIGVFYVTRLFLYSFLMF